MKKFIIIAAAAALTAACVCLLCACQDKPSPSTAPDSPETSGGEDNSTEEMPTRIGDDDPTIDINGFEEEGEDGAGDNAVVNESGIREFRYSFDGTIGGNNYYYEVRKEDGKVILECEFMEYYDYGTMSMEVPEDVLDQLGSIYLDQEIARWDGYSKRALYIDDGDGFSLNIGFNDGGTLSAFGNNCYPEGYWYFVNSVGEILEPYAQELRESARKEKIDAGVSGDLNFIMVNFSQQGSSGDDKYNFFITREGGREKNFDVQIVSESGEFFEKGAYNYYASLPDEAINFEGVRDLIEKYDLIKWYDYDETAEDYNNSEWFQISFSFDEGIIAAMGTEHPENYDGFRKEFLELMAEVIEKAEKEYGLEAR